jgi:hypothetical protein
MITSKPKQARQRWLTTQEAEIWRISVQGLPGQDSAWDPTCVCVCVCLYINSIYICISFLPYILYWHNLIVCS